MQHKTRPGPRKGLGDPVTHILRTPELVWGREEAVCLVGTREPDRAPRRTEAETGLGGSALAPPSLPSRNRSASRSPTLPVFPKPRSPALRPPPDAKPRWMPVCGRARARVCSDEGESFLHDSASMVASLRAASAASAASRAATASRILTRYSSSSTWFRPVLVTASLTLEECWSPRSVTS